jgi:hypothetical protein
MSLGLRLSDFLLRSASRRLNAAQGDWASAMTAELAVCGSEAERVRWALGCWWASLIAPGARARCTHPLALVLGLCLMASYEWNCDEGPVTLMLLAGLALALGILRPARAVASGLMLGLVVSAVLTFEVLSGLRPAYELRPTTLAHCLHWTVFVLPALLSAVLGGAVGRQFRLGVHR